MENESREDAALNESVHTAFLEIMPEFHGAVTKMTGYEIGVFDLITDEDLANPAHLGRDRGIKVTVINDHDLEPLENTLWGHETDATRIAQSLYAREFENRIGTVAIIYKTAEEAEPRLKLALDAADAERFPEVGDAGCYIRAGDWSEMNIHSDDIAWFEDPGCALAPKKPKTTAEEEEEILLLGREALQGDLHQSTMLLIASEDRIAESIHHEHFEETAILADELIKKSDAVISHVQELPVDPALDPARQEYLQGVQNFRDAGSYLWRGAVALDPDDFQAAETSLKSGEQHINAAHHMLDTEQIEEHDRTVPPPDPYPSALSLREPFSYRDESGANDVSVIIDYSKNMSGYSIEKNGTAERVNAGYTEKFLFVVLHVTHLGFRGNGTDTITTPPPEEFTLILEGGDYTHSNPDHYVRELGQPYESVTLERKEVYEGFLIYSIPEDANPAKGYIRLDLGEKGQSIWELS
ncbi:MAG: hypothetical protein QCH35_04615 [Methanomicrobiaceae archaeon]|nr:hypothetical protein [Methanomicrobiaceae archaeon]